MTEKDWIQLQPSIDSSLQILVRADISDRYLTLSFRLIYPEDITNSCCFVTNTQANGNSEKVGDRKDYLWQYDCLEFFLANASSGYLEFNLSFDGDWNVYQFNSYRNPSTVPPSWSHEWLLDRWQTINYKDEKIFKAYFKYTGSGEKFKKAEEPFLGNFTAITFSRSDKNRQISTPVYWAISHSRPKPDFHDQRYWSGNIKNL